MKRWFGIVAFYGLALALSACSSGTFTRLAYNNAASAYSNLGPMVTWMVDDYADLDNDHEDWVRTRIERTLAWHRDAELPKVRALLESMLEKSDRPFTVQDIASHQRELRASYHRLLAHMVPDTAEFLAALEPAQIAHIERKLEDDDRKALKEAVKGTPEERNERRAKRFINHLEAWVGRLDDAQRQLVLDRYHGVRDLSREQMGERRYRQSEVVAMVKGRMPRAAIEAGLKRIFVDTDSWRRPEYRDKLAERDARLHAIIADLSATLTEKQRAALQKRIRQFLRDISTLTASS